MAQQLGSLRGRGVSNQVQKHDGKLGMVGFWEGYVCLYIWVIGSLIVDSLLRVEGLLQNISHGFCLDRNELKHFEQKSEAFEG